MALVQVGPMTTENESTRELIDLDALQKVGPPIEPRAESRIGSSSERFEANVHLWLLVVWVAVVLVEVGFRVSGLPSASHEGSHILVGSLLAVLSGAIVVGCIRSKQRVRAEGDEPASVFGVSFSTRFLLVGIFGMVGGMALLCSAPCRL
jgi:hypothetical protein